MENSNNRNQELNNPSQGQNVRQGGQGTSETKDFSKNREGEYSNDSSRQSGSDIGRQGQNNLGRKDDSSVRQ